MKIGVIGIGVVGGAIFKSFCSRKIEAIPYDKYKNIGKLEDVLGVDIIFLSLPTPYDDSLKSYNKSALHDVCLQLQEKKYKGVVVVKSTVEPTTVDDLTVKYGLNMVHNPEFLTARTAYEDFENQNHIVLGNCNCSDEQLQMLIDFYNRYYPNGEISVCTSTESELMKISVNNFYSVKIQFFNEIYLLSQKLKIDYNTVKNIMLKNGWIYNNHVNVPGPDGKLSYGGMCFPKDTNALLQFMKKQNSKHDLLEATIKERNSLRDD